MLSLGCPDVEGFRPFIEHFTYIGVFAVALGANALVD
jgi:hypothetical protein